MKLTERYCTQNANKRKVIWPLFHCLLRFVRRFNWMCVLDITPDATVTDSLKSIQMNAGIVSSNRQQSTRSRPLPTYSHLLEFQLHPYSVSSHQSTKPQIG